MNEIYPLYVLSGAISQLKQGWLRWRLILIRQAILITLQNGLV